MPGDRGLAFVIIGLIGATALWVGDSRIRAPHPARALAPALGEFAAQASFTQDARFLEKAGEAGLAGAFMGELAERKGGERIRSLARDVSADFRWFNQELNRIASSRGLSMPVRLNAEKRAAFDRLAELNGAAFDTLWASRAIEMHDDAVDALASEAATGAYPEIKRFAQQSLPGVQRRIVLIEDAAFETGLLKAKLE